MTAPTYTVEIAFGSAPNAAVDVWTDVSAYVRGEFPISITRGRTDDNGDISPSRMSMTLDNTDGRFTSGDAGSPYWPTVTRGRKVRVSIARPGGGTSYRFTGFIDGWPLRWPSGGEEYAVAEIVAVDRMAADDRDTLRSIVAEEILYADPYGYWPLSEPSGSVAAGDQSTHAAGSLTIGDFGAGGEIAFGAGTGPWTDGSPAVMFTRKTVSEGRYLRGFLTETISGSAGMSVHVAFNASIVDGDHPGTLFSIGRYGMDRMVALYLWNDAGAMRLAMIDKDPATWSADPTKSPRSQAFSGVLTQGETHSLVLTVDALGNADVYLNGVQRLPTTYTVVAPWPVAEVCLGAVPGAYGSAAGGSTTGGAYPLYLGTMSHAAIIPTVLSSGAMTALADAVRNGFVGQLPSDRITKYAGWRGITALALEPGVLSTAHLDTTGLGVSSAMAQVAASEVGRLFVDGQGRYVLQDRHHRYNRPVVAALTSADVSPDAQVSDGVVIVNDVTATMPRGASVRVTDDASIALHGRYAATVEVLTTSADDLAAQAAWLATRNANPQPRVTALPVDLLTLPAATVAALLDVEIGDKVTVSSLPGQAATATVSLEIEGWTESISVTDWQMTFNTSQASTDAVWTLDHPTLSVLNANVLAPY